MTRYVRNVATRSAAILHLRPFLRRTLRTPDEVNVAVVGDSWRRHFRGSIAGIFTNWGALPAARQRPPRLASGFLVPCPSSSNQHECPDCQGRVLQRRDARYGPCRRRIVRSPGILAQLRWPKRAATAAGIFCNRPLPSRRERLVPQHAVRSTQYFVQGGQYFVRGTKRFVDTRSAAYNNRVLGAESQASTGATGPGLLLNGRRRHHVLEAIPIPDSRSSSP